MSACLVHLEHGSHKKHAVHVGPECDGWVGELGDAVVDEQRHLALPQPLPQLRALGLALLDVHDLELRRRTVRLRRGPGRVGVRVLLRTRCSYAARTLQTLCNAVYD